MTAHDCEPDAIATVNALAELHTRARTFSESSTAVELGITLRVAFVADSAFAWRLIETERFASGRLHRMRMLCFGLLEDMRRAVQERLDWADADEQFRATQMATPGGFPGVTADWVHTKDFDLVFGPSRYWLRQEICATTSAHTVILR